jgi:predicted O-methyltransferase YrrM
MSILPRLMKLYRDAGFTPLTGYNSYLFNNFMTAPFTRLFKDSESIGDWGLALQEVMFLEGFAHYLKPTRVMVIGNAHGWSTIALSLIFPEAAVVGIDPNLEGNAVTNAIAQAGGLRARAVEGRSPHDVKAIGEAQLGGPADLVLIDAIHRPENVIADFGAAKTAAAPDAIFAFHDVIVWNLVAAFNAIRERWAMQGRVATRTPSGMAVAWTEAPPGFVDYVEAFADDPEIYRSYRRAVFDMDKDKLDETMARIEQAVAAIR